MTKKEVLTASHWGVYHALVEDGTMVGVRPFEKDGDPSPMIEAVPSSLYHASRVAGPSVRAGWLDKRQDSDRGRRGSEPFVEVSWEAAYGLVADEIRRVRATYGNRAIFGGSYGWSSAGRFHHAKSQLSRFLNACGGFVSSLDNYSFGAGNVILPHVLGSTQAILGPHTSWEILADNTELFVCFGGLPLKNTQIHAGGLGNHKVRGHLHRARDNGAQFALISPSRSDLPPDLGAQWLAIRPNTDTALMLGLAYVLLDEGWCDHGFLERYCVGFERFLPYLTGTSDGIPKTPEWAAAITGIAPAEIRALATAMAKHRTFISLSWSVQRCDHGEQTYWMAILLAAMLGQIGLPGGGVGFGYASVHGTGNSVPAFAPPTFPAGRNGVADFIPVARVTDMLLNPGAQFDYDGRSLKYPDISLIYWCGGNPLHHHQDLNRLLRALRKAETIVVHEPWWTPFAKHADIVLPATTTSERNDIMATKNDRHVVAMKKAVEPIGRARNDFDIFSALAGRLGVEQAFCEGRDEMGWLRHIYDVAREKSAGMGVAMPPFETFWETGSLEMPAPDKPYNLFEAFRADPEQNRLKTPSGKIEIFSQTIAGFGYADCPGHPVWLEPAEWLGAAAARKFPLHLLSNQPASRLHSQLDMGPVSQKTKIEGREPVWINIGDAAARDIADGDIVRLFNARGACLAGARLTDQIRAGVVLMSTGAWYDPSDPGAPSSLEKAGNPNVLTLDKGTSKLAQATSAQTVLVEVEKWRGPLPPITAYDPPRFVDAGDLIAPSAADQPASAKS